MSEMVKVKQEAWDFFLYSYLGIVPKRLLSEEIQKEYSFYVASKCAQHAYTDLNRTLKFNEKIKKDNKKNKEIKSKFVNRLSYLIIRGILDLFENNTEPKDFDKKHHIICQNLITYANKMSFENGNEKILSTKQLTSSNSMERFTYGQAQKWVNMTLKYMWMTGLWDKELSNLKDFLHVPVDSYILEAAGDKTETDGLGISLKCRNGESKEGYREGNRDCDTLPWSQWSINGEKCDEYNGFQEELRKVVKTCSPFEWENDAWMKIAVKRNKENDLFFDYKNEYKD